VQDAGNVGAILRSAAAFGIRDAVLGKGCADAWSPKVLRAGAGAHFSMRLAEGADLAAAIEQSTIARFLMDTTVPFVLTVLGPLLPPDIKSVVDLLPGQ